MGGAGQGSVGQRRSGAGVGAGAGAGARKGDACRAGTALEGGAGNPPSAPPVASAPKGSPTALYPTGTASQPLLEPPVTARATALETPSGPVAPPRPPWACRTIAVVLCCAPPPGLLSTTQYHWGWGGGGGGFPPSPHPLKHLAKLGLRLIKNFLWRLWRQFVWTRKILRRLWHL